MALRTGHGKGAGVPRVEVLPADELPRPVAPPLAAPSVPLVFRHDGKIADSETARALGKKGGLTKARRVRLVDSLGLKKIAADASFKRAGEARTIGRILSTRRRASSSTSSCRPLLWAGRAIPSKAASASDPRSEPRMASFAHRTKTRTPWAPYSDALSRESLDGAAGGNAGCSAAHEIEHETFCTKFSGFSGSLRSLVIPEVARFAQRFCQSFRRAVVERGLRASRMVRMELDRVEVPLRLVRRFGANDQASAQDVQRGHPFVDVGRIPRDQAIADLRPGRKRLL
jgi:hypothetical protein